MKKNRVDREIKEYFKNYPSFSREDLYNFYLRYELDLNPQTFGWRVFDLKKKNIITAIRRGIYKISDKQQFNPQLDKELQKIARYLNGNFFDLNFMVWTTKWINDFTLHMAFQTFYVIETPVEQTEVVFNKLKESGRFNVYHQPDDKLMYKYVIEEDVPIVVKTLISRSPLKRVKKIKIPSLEKILIDLYCDKKIFYMYQGNELIEIYRNALNNYVINITKLLNYARRRNRRDEIEEFLSNNFMEFIEELLND